MHTVLHADNAQRDFDAKERKTEESKNDVEEDETLREKSHRRKVHNERTEYERDGKCHTLAFFALEFIMLMQN